MKRRYLTAGLMLISGAAAAQPYMGVQIGTLDYDLPHFDNPTTLELYVGNRFNENFALEFNYIDLGESEDGIPPVWTLSGESFGGALKLFAPLSDQVELTGRIGVHSWNLELTEEGFGTLAEDDGTDLFYGFGVNLGLSRNLGLGAHYTIYDFDEDDASVMSFNLQFRF